MTAPDVSLQDDSNALVALQLDPPFVRDPYRVASAALFERLPQARLIDEEPAIAPSALPFTRGYWQVRVAV